MGCFRVNSIIPGLLRKCNFNSSANNNLIPSSGNLLATPKIVLRNQRLITTFNPNTRPLFVCTCVHGSNGICSLKNKRIQFNKAVLFAKGCDSSFNIRKFNNKNMTEDTDLITNIMGPRTKSRYFNHNKMGQGLVACWAALGLGALCYYGVLRSETGPPPDAFLMWRDEVRERIRRTYAYFGTAVVTTGMSAAYVFRSKDFMRILMKHPWMILATCVFSQLLSGILVLHMKYKWGFSWKRFVWLIHTMIVGVTLAPLSYYGGPIMVRAFFLYGGIMSGLSVVAYTAPDRGFLMAIAPISIALGFILAATLATFVFPGSSQFGAGLMAVYLYGCLILLAIMLINDTHKIMKDAQEAEIADSDAFDPINAAMLLYMNALNMIVRFVQFTGAKELSKRFDE